MKILLLVYLLVCAFNAENVHPCYNVEGYYWRDYTGNIPSDALPGGTDDKGNLIYIGQALLPLTCSIVPGLIRSTSKIMTLEMRLKEEKGTQDIKILCTAHPEHFQWIKTAHELKASTFLKGEQQFITAGLDVAGPLIVGRASVGDEVLVGKVIVSTNDVFLGVHIGKDGKGLLVPSFELLVYDPTLSKDRECYRSKTITVNVY